MHHRPFRQPRTIQQNGDYFKLPLPDLPYHFVVLVQLIDGSTSGPASNLALDIVRHNDHQTLRTHLPEVLESPPWYDYGRRNSSNDIVRLYFQSMVNVTSRVGSQQNEFTRS